MPVSDLDIHRSAHLSTNGGPATLDNPVKAPHTAAGDGEIEENKAVDHRQLALIQQREKAARCMGHEVGDGHLAGEDEGYRPDEQAENEQNAADDLERAGKPY